MFVIKKRQTFVSMQASFDANFSVKTRNNTSLVIDKYFFQLRHNGF